MKTLKCPLCGGLLEHIEEGYLHIVQCQDCLLAAQGAMTEEEAWTNANNLLADFPPIMRVQVGDKVEVLETGNRSRIAEVRQVRVKQGVIAVVGSRRLYNAIDVFRWPWKLEQEGGK